MAFPMIGSIDTYTKTLKMKFKWKEKQDSGQVFQKPAEASAKQASSILSETQKPAQTDIFEPEDDETRLKSLHIKVFSGANLTPAERKFLQDKDPVSYSRLLAAEESQKAYDRALKRCKTRDEVRHLQMSGLGSSMAAAKAGGSGDGGKAAAYGKMQMDKLEKETQKFIRQGGYRALPTQAEVNQAARDERKARERHKLQAETAAARKVRRARRRAAMAHLDIKA